MKARPFLLPTGVICYVTYMKIRNLLLLTVTHLTLFLRQIFSDPFIIYVKYIKNFDPKSFPENVCIPKFDFELYLNIELKSG